MKRKVFSWTLVILWMALIFYMSHQPATKSSELSSGITVIISDIIQKVVTDIKLNQDSLSHIIRKSAHFLEYMVLGVLVVNSLLDTDKPKPRLIFLAILMCILYAISDEIHQIFVPGRSGQVSDVLIDSLGGLAGVLGMSVIRGRLSKP